jgi:hypothetical protein
MRLVLRCTCSALHVSQVHGGTVAGANLRLPLHTMIIGNGSHKWQRNVRLA